MGALTAEDLPLVRKLRVAAETCRPQDLRRCAGIEEDAWLMGSFCTLHMPVLWEMWTRANTADARADAHANISHRLYIIEMDIERLELFAAEALNRSGRTIAEQRKLDIAMSVAVKYDEERKATELNALLEAEHRARAHAVYREPGLEVGPALCDAKGELPGRLRCSWARTDARGVRHMGEVGAFINPALGELVLPSGERLGPEWAPLLRRAADIMEKRTVES